MPPLRRGRIPCFTASKGVWTLLFELSNLDSIHIGMASPEQIRSWSHGEVTKPETINYRTLKPERDGLYCEVIFGPTKDWECACGKYKRIKTKDREKVCEKCGVQVTRSKVRRERMGHIELAAPVSHIWYFKGIPSRMGLLLDVSPRNLEKVLYFANFIVIDPGNTDLKKLEIINDTRYREVEKNFGVGSFKAKMGAEAIKELLQEVDLEELSVQLKTEISKLGGDSQKRARAVKRLEVVEAFRGSGNKPEWMVLDVVPVIPPDLRPLIPLDGGRFATSDLNDLYRRVINRNNRLKRLLELGAPDIIVRNEKRMLQESVDALIDNGRRGRPVTGPGNRALKSLSDLLRGKQGRFRQNLLGKRVDYSGRSVIVVGPELKLHQCGLPKEMALELFKPFVMQRLVADKIVQNVKSAKKAVERVRPEVWDILEDVIREHPVMLNRAPTLHRLGIQAFEPVLVEGKAIKLHPLACTAFNADFDGDQMAVHVPLSMEAQAEARFLMLAHNNVLKPQDGKPVMSPSQDMVMGCYYLTLVNRNDPSSALLDDDGNPVVVTECNADDEGAMTDTGSAAPRWVRRVAYSDDVFQKDDEGNIRVDQKGYRKLADGFEYQVRLFRDQDEATMAYNIEGEGHISLQAPIRVRIYREFRTPEGDVQSGYRVIKTTLGRLIFNDAIPQDMGFQKRECLDDMFILEIADWSDQKPAGKKQLAKIVDYCFRSQGEHKCALVLDRIKSLGYRYSTVSATTVSVADIKVPKEKAQELVKADSKVNMYNMLYHRGLFSDEERYTHVIKLWNDTTARVRNTILPNLDELNPIRMMTDSGARGSAAQVSQLAGMRGLMASPTGRTSELPIRANFREGLNVLEFFTSSHGSRKSLSDTALRTADSGYLTRRLVDVAQEVIIREDDCCADGSPIPGITVEPLMSGNNVIEPLEDRLRGRTLAESIDMEKTDPDGTVRSLHVAANTPIDHNLAEKIVKFGVTSARVRSVLTCHTKHGVCAKCYGENMAHGGKVDIGEAVGIIAAQAIGEPGTQLTMRTFHTGGIAGGEDITQGLPRVEELFEARKPKREAVLSEISGTVSIQETKKKRELVITGNEYIMNPRTKKEELAQKTYQITYDSRLKVQDGDHVEAGQELIEGSINPHELLRISGVKRVQDYLLTEVLSVYRLQGVAVADKHIEIIIHQMLQKVRVEEVGETDLLPGTTIDIGTFDAANMAVMSKYLEAGEDIPKGATASAKRILLGITKASLATESFLSAASFQETTRVLTDAAIKGKDDYLVGLKENVIIGKQIPAGTGLHRYKDITVHENVY